MQSIWEFWVGVVVGAVHNENVDGDDDGRVTPFGTFARKINATGGGEIRCR